MKKIFYLVALFAAVVFTACDSNVQTPQGDKTKLWPAGKKDSKLFGYMDKSGNLEIAPKYDEAYGFSCGWALVVEDKEYMFIDKSAKNKHSVDKDEIGDYYFYYNYLPFKDGKYRGMWDKNFAVVIPADYDFLGNPTADKLVAFSEDYYGDDEGCGYLDMNGNVAIEPQWYYAHDFIDGMAVVSVIKRSGDDYVIKDGIINKKGEYLIEPQKNELFSMGENRFAMVKSNGKIVLCDKNLEELSGSYDDMYVFSCGMAQVYKEDKGYGFIDKNGQEIVSCKYKEAYDYTDDVVVVKKDDDSKIEVLDKKGESILKLKDGDKTSGFHNGLACVSNYDSDAKEVNYRYINKKGEVIYKWTPGDDEDDDDDDDEAPARWQERRRQNILQTEAGPLFLNYERAKQRKK